MSETVIQNELRVMASEAGGHLWRNNNGAFKDDYGRWIRYGLNNDSEQVQRRAKSSDLIGPLPRLIKPHHVGETWGVFAAIECKPPDWSGPSSDHELAQARFIGLVLAAGGIASFVNSKEGARYVIGG